MMIIRPLVAVGRQDIGFLPGDKNEKLEPWFATVEDTMAALREDLDHSKARAMLEGWVEAGDAVHGGRDLPARAGPSSARSSSSTRPRTSSR